MDDEERLDHGRAIQRAFTRMVLLTDPLLQKYDKNKPPSIYLYSANPPSAFLPFHLSQALACHHPF